MAVLPTGFGTRMIFTVFGTAVNEKLADRPVSVAHLPPQERYIGPNFGA